MKRLFLYIASTTLCIEPAKYGFFDIEPKVAFKHEWQNQSIDFALTLTIPEFVYEQNLLYLNNANLEDRFILFRHYLDAFATYHYRPAGSDHDYLSVRCGLRSRSQWELHTLIPQLTVETIKETGVVFGSHFHYLLFKPLWIRELWAQLSLNDVLGLNFSHTHFFTIGAFFYELGRGISLGINYPPLPALVGLLVNNYVDEYPFGAKLWGELDPTLKYDIYGALFVNRASTFFYTTERTRSNEYGHCTTGERGFGAINYLFSSRLQWTPFAPCDKKRVYLEPYVLYHYNPEAMIVDLRGSSSLVTYGLMGEFQRGSIEWGFEFAFNVGHVHFAGTDRNQLAFENNGGTLQIANTQVTDEVTQADAPATPENQTQILCSPRTVTQNGAFLSPQLRNQPFRFFDPMAVSLKGHFFVIDGSYIVKDKVLRVSAAFGYASGDRDPRVKFTLAGGSQHTEVEYNGFIGINELYYGRRVFSFLVFNPAIPRPLDVNGFGIQQDTPISLEGFSNIIYAGLSADYQYELPVHTLRFYPNLLWFWVPEPAHKLILKTENDIPTIIGSKEVRSYLGAELSLFAEIRATERMLCYVLAGIFFPGKFYDDLKGTPLNPAQVAYVQDPALPREPLLGNDPAFALYVGLRYWF